MAELSFVMDGPRAGRIVLDGQELPKVTRIRVDQDWSEGSIPQVDLRLIVTDGLMINLGDADVRVDLTPLTVRLQEECWCECEGSCSLDSDDVPTGPCKLKREIPKEIRHLVGREAEDAPEAES